MPVMHPHLTPEGAPHPHRILAERLWEGIAQPSPEILRELLDEKSVWRMYGRSPLAGTYVGADEIIAFLAFVGELTTDLRSELVDIFVSDRGAVMRYTVEAQRGGQQLETEHLFLLTIEHGRIVRATFAPLDQGAYDKFFSPPWLA